uniref:Uncharacterized protein n=1 Tax=Arundo donax TaxID=35708 RepID=A0A0A9AF73_ARUDO
MRNIILLGKYIVSTFCTMLTRTLLIVLQNL